MATQETISVKVTADTSQYTSAMQGATNATKAFKTAADDFRKSTDSLRIKAAWGSQMAAAAKKAGLSFNDLKAHIAAVQKGMNATASEAVRLTLAEIENAVAQASLAQAYDRAVSAIDDEKKSMKSLRDEIEKTRKENDKLNSSLKGAKTIGGLSVAAGIAISALTTLLVKAFHLMSQAAQEGLKDVLEWSKATGHSFASTMSTIQNNLNTAKGALGSALASVISALAPAINWIINAVTAAANAVSWLIALVSGKSTYVKAVNAVNTGMNSAMSSVAEYADTAASSLDDATKSAKELQKTLMGFDVIHKLDAEQKVSDNVNPVGGGGGGGFGGGGIGDIGVGFEEEEVTEHPIYKFFTNLWKKVKEIWGNFSDWIVKKWTTFKSKAAELWLKIRDKLVSIWNKIKDKAVAIWNKTRDKIVSIWNKIKDKAVTIWNKVKDKVVEIWNKVKEKASAIWNAIKDKVVNIWNKVKDKATSIWGSIRDKIVAIWNKVKEKAVSIWSAIKEKARTIWEQIKEVIGTKASQLWGAVKTAFATLKANISTKWSEIKEKARTWWESIKTVVGTKAGQIWGAVKTGVSTIKTNLATVWDNIRTAAGTWWIAIKNRIYNTVSGLWSYIKAPFETVYEKVKGIWESIKGWIKDIFDGASNIKTPTVQKPGTSPRMASGGYPSTGQMFIAREAGPELVGTIGNRTAVVNNDQIVASVSAGVAQAVASVLGGGGGATEVNVYMDSQSVAKAAFKGQQRLKRRYDVVALV